jgi:hypothetical protein
MDQSAGGRLTKGSLRGLISRLTYAPEKLNHFNTAILVRLCSGAISPLNRPEPSTTPETGGLSEPQNLGWRGFACLIGSG